MLFFYFGGGKIKQDFYIALHLKDKNNIMLFFHVFVFFFIFHWFPLLLQTPVNVVCVCVCVLFFVLFFCSFFLFFLHDEIIATIPIIIVVIPWPLLLLYRRDFVSHWLSEEQKKQRKTHKQSRKDDRSVPSCIVSVVRLHQWIFNVFLNQSTKVREPVWKKN